MEQHGRSSVATETYNGTHLTQLPENGSGPTSDTFAQPGSSIPPHPSSERQARVGTEPAGNTENGDLAQAGGHERHEQENQNAGAEIGTRTLSSEELMPGVSENTGVEQGTTEGASKTTDGDVDNHLHHGDRTSRMMRRVTTRFRAGEPWTFYRAARFILLTRKVIKVFSRNLKSWEHICDTCKKLELHQNKFIVSQHSSNPRDQAYRLLLSPSHSPHSAAGTSASGLNRYYLGSLSDISERSINCPFCKLVERSLEEINTKFDEERVKCAGVIKKLKEELSKYESAIDKCKTEIQEYKDLGSDENGSSNGNEDHSAGPHFLQEMKKTSLPAWATDAVVVAYQQKVKTLREKLSSLAACAEGKRNQITDSQKELSKLTDQRTEVSGARCFASFQMDGREVKRDSTGMVIDSRPRTRRIRLSWSDQRLPTSYIVLVAPESGAGYHPDQHHSWESITSFLARNIGVASKNDARIKQWVNLCHTHHGELCNSEPGGNFHKMISKAFFGVVDVGAMKLTALPPGERYVALSYAWGHPNQYTTNLKNIRLHQEPGGLDQVFQRLPKVIQDAIHLVRSIGEKYLWVDSLCIVQKNTVSWDLNSSVMDLVYGNAYLTICAAEGEGAQAGLIALDPNRKVSQYIEECADGLRLTVSHLAETYIGQSRWNTRGWTFQERLLSRRCIVFAGSRVFFQCRATTFSEDVNSEHESVGWSIELVRVPLQLIVNIRTTAFAVYMECIRLYTKRRLGESKDILAAFQGMLNLFRQEMGAPLQLGLPTSHFDIALLWEPTSACVRRVPKTKEGEDFGGLVFPSWSWAGWAGSPIDYHKETIAGCLPNVNQWLAEHTWIHWYIRDGHGDLRPIWNSSQTSQQQDLTPTDSRWLGYGCSQDDKYGRMVKKEYLFDGEKPLQKDVFTRTLPEYPFGIGQASADSETRVTFPAQPVLQFWSWVANFRVVSRIGSHPASPEALAVSGSVNTGDNVPPEDGLVRCDIEDYCGDWCGTIVLNAEWFKAYSRYHPDQYAVHEFIAISEAQTFSKEESDTWTYYVPHEKENADWDLFYVLLVTQEAGICYRQGLGKVFKEAFAKSYLPGKEWKEIIMG
jgi:hypothetical protein